MQVAGLVVFIGLAISGLTEHVVIGLGPSASVTVSGPVTFTTETDSLGIATFVLDCELPPCTVTLRVGDVGPAANSGGCEWSERR